MSFTGVLGLIVLGITAVALLGPTKLPAGIEQLWLMITNFRRSGAEMRPLTLEEARRIWAASENPLYDLVQILWGSVEHLMELRHRIFMVLGTMLAGGVVAMFFTPQILSLLLVPKPIETLLIFTHPTDMMFTYIEVILSVAAVFALPMLVFQALLFIRPALESTEELSAFRSIAFLGVPMLAVFFVMGLSFAYYIMLPFALRYLASFGAGIATAQWTIRAYYGFVLGLMLWIGAAFQTPLVMAILARLGMVSPKAMLKQWRFAILGVAVVAAVITPTVDPMNMALIMAPLLALYFLGVLFARLVYRPRRTTTIEQPKLEAGS